MKEKNAIPETVTRHKDYEKAISCTFCNNTADSFGRYVSTYCHKFHEHLAGFGDGTLSRCRDCPAYAPRDPKHGSSGGGTP